MAANGDFLCSLLFLFEYIRRSNFIFFLKMLCIIHTGRKTGEPFKRVCSGRERKGKMDGNQAVRWERGGRYRNVRRHNERHKDGEETMKDRAQGWLGMEMGQETGRPQ